MHRYTQNTTFQVILSSPQLTRNVPQAWVHPIHHYNRPYFTLEVLQASTYFRLSSSANQAKEYQNQPRSETNCYLFSVNSLLLAQRSLCLLRFVCKYSINFSYYWRLFEHILSSRSLSHLNSCFILSHWNPHPSQDNSARCTTHNTNRSSKMVSHPRKPISTSCNNMPRYSTQQCPRKVTPTRVRGLLPFILIW